MGLISHSGCFNVTEEQLAKLPCPEPTKTHRPVSHIQVVDKLKNMLTKDAGFQITRTSLAVNGTGSKMFGVMDLGTDFGKNYMVGFRNSHDKSMSLGMTAGLRVTVCDNMLFSGDGLKIFRKHTPGIDVERFTEENRHHFIEICRGLDGRVETMKSLEISMSDAKRIIMTLAIGDVIPPNKTVPVWEEFVSPRYKEFAEERPNLWKLNNAFTTVAKDYPFTRAESFHRVFPEVFQRVIDQRKCGTDINDEAILVTAKELSNDQGAALDTPGVGLEMV